MLRQFIHQCQAEIETDALYNTDTSVVCTRLCHHVVDYRPGFEGTVHPLLSNYMFTSNAGVLNIFFIANQRVTGFLSALKEEDCN